MSAEREVVYWDCDQNKEHLLHTDITEAVCAWADQYEGQLPETVTVHGFARVEIPSEEWIVECVLDHLLERIDEEHSDPDGDGTKPTKAMQAAAADFARVFRDEYECWACEEITEQVVRVADHVPADWLSSPGAAESST